MAELHAPGWVAAAVSREMSAAAGLREYRAAGGKIRDAVWRKLYAEQKVAKGRMLDEMTAPLEAIPDYADATIWTTKRREGFVQTVDIFVRLAGTDTVVTRPFMLTVDNLISRGEALSTALTQMNTAVDEGRYDEVVLGGVYTGTRILQRGDTE